LWLADLKKLGEGGSRSDAAWAIRKFWKTLDICMTLTDGFMCREPTSRKQLQY
jgi:hypothetical protein